MSGETWSGTGDKPKVIKMRDTKDYPTSDKIIADLRAELANLQHDRQDNDALLWKVAEQQKEIERLRAEIAAYVEGNPVLREMRDDDAWEGL